MTTQIAIKIADDLLARVDELVARGEFPSRSAAVRQGLMTLLLAQRRREIDKAFRDGFRQAPEAEEELSDANRLAVEAIHDEVWEKWW